MKTPKKIITEYLRDGDDLEITGQGIAQALDAAGYEMREKIPDGYAIVPKEPTEEMIEAGLDDPNAEYCDRCMQSGHVRNSGFPTVIWQAMLAAAPDAKKADHPEG